MFKKLSKHLGITASPVVLVLLFLFLIIGGSNVKDSSSTCTGGNTNLPEKVLRWEDKVVEETKKNGIPEAVNYILGLIMVETGGDSERYPDIMQASESQGRPPNSINDPNESIEVGVAYFSGAYK